MRRANSTGALYGVVNMLRKLVQDHKAEYAVCVSMHAENIPDDLFPTTSRLPAHA